jgi:exodeoxyribonuclease VII large subunit
MVGVDPEFTLGKLAQNRERILRALSAEGLLERNAQLDLPMPPLRVGLLTSLGSAAYNDFVQELRRSGFAFSLLACDVRVQGSEAEAQIVAALGSLAKRKPDVIALIRGGGSRGDLAAFDSEAIARRIALLKVPVWTGIGHEIDSSVADAVAHRSFKTPTACAAALVEAVQECVQESEDLWREIVRAAGERTAEQRLELRRFGRELIRSTRALLRAQDERLSQALRRALREAERSAQRRRQTLERHEGRLAELARLRAWQEFERLRALHVRLPQVRRRLREAAQHADAIAARVRALDPQRVLARGYSLSWSAGRLVRSVTELGPGAHLRTEFADGEVESRVESIHVQPKEGA